MVQNAKEDKYMLMVTLKEIIINKPESLKPFLQILMPLYIGQSQNSGLSDTERSIVSESIGRLYAAHPVLQDQILAALKGNNPQSIETVAKSIQYSAFISTNAGVFQQIVPILIELAKNDVKGHLESDKQRLEL